MATEGVAESGRGTSASRRTQQHRKALSSIPPPPFVSSQVRYCIPFHSALEARTFASSLVSAVLSRRRHCNHPPTAAMSYYEQPNSPGGMSTKRLTNRNTNRYSVTALFSMAAEQDVEIEDDLARGA